MVKSPILLSVQSFGMLCFVLIEIFCIFVNWIVEKEKADSDTACLGCDSERIRTFIVRTGILNSIH